MSGGQVAGAFDVGNPGLGWHAVATGDLGGTGKSDILFQNDSGEVLVWVMDDPNIISSGSLGNLGSTLQLVATGDFNGDGLADLLFQDSDGEVDVVGTGVIGTVGNPGPTWHVQPDDGFYQPERADLPWQTDGSAVVFLQNDSGDGFPLEDKWNDYHRRGQSRQSRAGLAPQSDRRLQRRRQSRSSVAERHRRSSIWELNGTTVISAPSLGNPGPSWHIVGTGDFNDDGKSDILWQNTDGQAAIWLMNGTAPITETVVGANPGPSWHIVGTGDFNGDGFSDILWQSDSGLISIWEMNGDHRDRQRRHRQQPRTELAHLIGPPARIEDLRGTGRRRGDLGKFGRDIGGNQQ